MVRVLVVQPPGRLEISSSENTHKVGTVDCESLRAPCVRHTHGGLCVHDEFLGSSCWLVVVDSSSQHLQTTLRLLALLLVDTVVVDLVVPVLVLLVLVLDSTRLHLGSTSLDQDRM